MEFQVLHISNGAYLCSGTFTQCIEYLEKYGYWIVKKEGQQEEYWYVE